MQLNRIYTYARDEATRKKVKSCLVRREIEDSGMFGISLAPCDTDDRELVLAVELPKLDHKKLAHDEFVLKEVSFLDDGNAISSPYCVAASYKSDGEWSLVSKKTQLRRKNPLVLTDCASTENLYAQEFKAKYFSKAASSRLVVEEDVEVKAEIGRFCLQESSDLCLGVSLKEGITLTKNVFVQVKNYTKNEAKNLHDLKMRWYHDLQNGRIATAAEMNYCMEAIYDAPIGENRAGRPQFDDIVHLGNCDALARSEDDVEEAFRGLPKSEKFYTKAVTTPAGSFLELRTDVPIGASTETETKCVSIVRCIKHDNDHCTPYNSNPVFDVEELSQGAHARLKECNSAEMVSQRFFYVADIDITVPPTNYPTPQVTSSPTTSAPTTFPTTAAPTDTPKEITEAPTVFVEPVVTTEPQEPGTEDEPSVKSSQNVGLLASLGFLGFLCLIIIIVAAGYYYKHRTEFKGLPEEDENFIARV